MSAPLRALPAASLAVFLYVCLNTATCYSGMVSGGSPTVPDADGPGPPRQTVAIPGPLRSFERMAGISQKVPAEDVLPLLARNVVVQGYQGRYPTEFLILIDHYLNQARELQSLAGSDGSIRIADCSSAGTLLGVLGFRLTPGCGQKGAVLATKDPVRAFLTIDSGFPVTVLEQDLQKNLPFTFAFPTTRVPVLLTENDWSVLGNSRGKSNGNLVDVLLHDPAVSRLYWALARNDSATRTALQRSPGLRSLLPYGGVLDFYGSQICIRSGRVLVPGGPASESSWKDLVGASPASPAEFVTHLVARDNGWLALYFDALSRTTPDQQAHLTQDMRLKRLYEAFRSPVLNEYAARASYRRATPLLVLFTRLQWDPDGSPHVPGNLDVWKDILAQKTDTRLVHEWSKRARRWHHPDQLLEAMVAFSHISTDASPLDLYLTLSELDRVRPPEQHLSAPTVRLLANGSSQRIAWYQIFSEFPELNDQSMSRFANVAESIDGISHLPLRGNTLGIFQAEIGLWQILARQREIPKSRLNESWQEMIEDFARVSSSTQLLDASDKSIGGLLLAATGRPGRSQDEVIDLLAGPRQTSSDGLRMHDEMANRIRSVLEDQRLASLDTLFSLSDGMRQMEHGAAVGGTLVPLAEDLHEFEMPRAIFTENERIAWTPTIYTSRHAELQIRTDLTKVLKAPASDAQLESARGQLAPFVRDTLVGLNYAYYEPPGAQVLHNNPLFVRSHDFSGFSIQGAQRPWRAPQLFGIGMPAGGGAYLIGSLADLPYALATVEEDFISPENVQALIWKEVVPEILVSSTLPRWWHITPNELHAASLYQRSGEELLAASVKNAQLRNEVISILSERMPPQRLEQTDVALQAGLPPHLLPTDTLYLSAELRARFPAEDTASLGPANQDLDNLRRQYPAETALDRLSRDFGTPHPTISESYSLELLNVRPFPASAGEASRAFGECWESNNLYWARLADEMHLSPVMLHRYVPELTRRMVAKIFATDLEDWSAMQRAMQETGDEFRQGKIPSLTATNEALGP
jgi:hypothetical protein